MSARPPPTRPHIGLNPSSRFGTYSLSEWVEDDAWDSGSDEEASGSTWRPAHSRTSSSTAPKPVPNPHQNSSSSTLASSYTHVNAPSPSSYPPRSEQPVPQSAKQGWTIITNAREGSVQGKQHEAEQLPGPDGDLIVGDFDPDDTVGAEQNTQSAKPRQEQGTVRDDMNDIVKDPLNLVHRAPSGNDSFSEAGDDVPERIMRERSIRLNRRQRFVDCVTSEDVSMAQLRKLAWSGVPSDLRPVVWPLLLGYLPLPAHLRISTLARKRSEYLSLVELAFARNRDALDQQIWHQIEIDVPRTRPGVPLWMHASTQRSLERILYVWAIRHPASGYVQGINDLVTPFFQVFLSAYIDSDPEEFDPAVLPTEVLNAVEADSFWCLSRLLDGIQDNYIAGQPGIQRSVKRMAELVARIDPPLAAHLDSENVEFMQFAFRWMNCLLMREISVQNTIRMWDTYLVSVQSVNLMGIIMFLQSLPTHGWTDHEIELLLSEAFVHYSTWHNAQSHFGK
ncbi:RabGAP/TBC [Trametopsis cervina]|nr:RabGAP/TBC [Trametopsis cervina]